MEGSENINPNVNSSFKSAKSQKSAPKKLLGDARNSVPETGCGRVMHLVKVFEKEKSQQEKTIEWTPPGLQPPKKEDDESEKADANETEVKRRRDKLLEDARNSVPEIGCGRVMHLVKAFEKLRAISSSKGLEEKQQEKTMKWTLPRLQPPKQIHTDDPSSFCPSQLILPSEDLGLDPRISVSSSWDNSCEMSVNKSCASINLCEAFVEPGEENLESFNYTNTTIQSYMCTSSRFQSVESSSGTLGRRLKKKQLKVTSPKPFNLRTEQRGKMKEEDFMRKVHEMMTEEEKQRIPIAQGLPLTTFEPECLVKPPVKDNTRPIDLMLHSDLRAMDRAVFDRQVAEKMSMIEQYKMERERRQKLEEREEIRRLRKELIPKAQPMPNVDRPVIPRRSMKHPTIAREPKFHIPQH